MLFCDMGPCRIAVSVMKFVNDVERPEALNISDLHVISLHLCISEDILCMEEFHFIYILIYKICT